VALLMIALASFGVRNVRAQQLSLTISPPLTEMVIKPGKSVVIAYTITNLGEPVTLVPGVRPFAPQGTQGNLIIEKELSGPIRFNLENSNIQLDAPFSLPSRQGQQLLLKIRVPEGTPEGDYYYTFLAESKPGNLPEGTSASRAASIIGANILITVTESGAVIVKGSIGQFAVIPQRTINILGKKLPFFESTDTIPIVLIINNTGNNLIKPYGTINLSGNFGERAEYSLLPQNILSQSSRLITATPSANISNGSSSLTIKGFFVGKYTLTASLDFGTGTEKQTTAVVFYALPFKLIIATLFALIIGISLVKNLGKSESVTAVPNHHL